MSRRDGKQPKTAALLLRGQRLHPPPIRILRDSAPDTGHKELEVILTRQLADCLAMPIFIVDCEGTLLFYNEPAERLLGMRFDETGELGVAQWSTAFVPTDNRGHPLPREKLPLVIALQERRPTHSDLRIQGLDGVVRHIQATAFPLIGRANRFLGAVAIFWEVPKTA